MIYLYLFMAPYVLECCVDSEVETARGRDGHVVDTHRTGTIGCRSRDLRIGARVAGQQEEVAAGNRGSEPLDVGVAFLEEPGEVTITLTVMDDKGAVSDPVSKTITIVEPEPTYEEPVTQEESE